MRIRQRIAAWGIALVLSGITASGIRAEMSMGYSHGVENPGEIVKIIKDSISGAAPTLLYVFSTPDLHVEKIIEDLGNAYPGVPMWGCTSAKGIHIPRQGFLDGKAVAVMAQQTPLKVSVHGFAVSGTEWLENTAKIIAAEKGKHPSMILLASTPEPQEEEIMEALKAHFGRKVRIYGGSAGSWGKDPGDNPWPRRIIYNGKTAPKGAAFCFIYGENTIADTYLMGFSPLNKKRGNVTRSVGRIVYEINGKPAIYEYNAMADDFFKDAIQRKEDVRVSGLQVERPLAIVNKGTEGRESFITLSAASFNHEDGSISFFATVPEGSEVVVMDGGGDATQGLAVRFQEGAAELNRQIGGYRKLDGGLFFICMGSHNIYGKTYPLSAMTAPLNTAFREKPWIGVSCNGENGRIAGPEAESMHGNLMAAGIAFEK